MSINSLPKEIINEVLGYLSPEDQSALSCASRSLNQTVTAFFQKKMAELCTFIQDCDHQIAQITEGKERLIAPQPRYIVITVNFCLLVYIASCVHPQMLQDMQLLKATAPLYEACKESVVDALADCSFSDLEKIQSTTKLALQLLDQAKNTMKGSLSVRLQIVPYTQDEWSDPIMFGVHVFNRESLEWSDYYGADVKSVNNPRFAPFRQRLKAFFETSPPEKVEREALNFFPTYLPVGGKNEGDSFYLPRPLGAARSDIRIKLVCRQKTSPEISDQMPFEKATALAVSRLITGS